jgi:hypothetical protein
MQASGNFFLGAEGRHVGLHALQRVKQRATASETLNPGNVDIAIKSTV